jgi:chemotaxis protein histidine kinase CheA
MSTLNEYFRTEAQDFLTALERSLQRTPAPDAAELHRSVRGLRGTAQMARAQRIVDAVSAFETVTRSLAAGGLAWSDQFAARARDTIADLRVLLDGTEGDEQLDARVSGAAARWTNTDVAPPPQPPAVTPDGGTRELREFAAREAAGIADALDTGIRDLQADPMDREPLRTILRRQRALLGSARLDEIPVIAEILRAVEELSRVIAKLDVGVKQEWLDIYRVARDALQTTIAPLLRDEVPEPSKALSRLRHMRAELLERYGTGDDDAGSADDAFAEPTLSHIEAPRTPLFAQDSSSATAPDGIAAAPPTPASPAAFGSATTVPYASEVPQGARQPEDEAVLDLSTADEVASEDDAVLDLPAADEVASEDDAVLDLSAADEVASADDAVLDLSAADEVASADDAVLDLSAADEVASEDDAVLEIGVLGYTREDALKRALELRESISRAVAHDPRARDAIDELFDLLRIALE